MKKTGSIPEQNPKQLKPSEELLELQHLMPISTEDKDNLEKDILMSKKVRDAVKVYRDEEGDLFILAGYNRWEIALKHNIKVPVDIYEGTEQEYRELVINDNLNRRHMSAGDKAKLVKFFLKETPDLSDRTIAKKAKVDHKTVSKKRKEMESTGEIPQLNKTMGNDGKKRSNPQKNKPQKNDNIKTQTTGKEKPVENIPSEKYNSRKVENIPAFKIKELINDYSGHIKQLNGKKAKKEGYLNAIENLIGDLEKLLK